LERRITHPALDEEVWRASRYRYVRNRGRTFRLPRIGGASFYTGTQAEVLYASIKPGTAKATFTTEAVINDEGGMGPQVKLAADFFQPTANLALARALRIIARGIYSTTSAPTWQTFVRLGSKASTAGPNIGSTAATALGSTQTNLLWEHEEDAVLEAQGTTAGTSTIRGLGVFSAMLTASTSLQLAIFGGGASPGTVTTVDPTITNYINFDAACGTSNASNSIQLLQLIIMGLN